MRTMFVLTICLVIQTMGCDSSDVSKLKESPPGSPHTLEDYRDCVRQINLAAPPDVRQQVVFGCAARAFTPEACARGWEDLGSEHPASGHASGIAILRTCSQSYCEKLPHALCTMSPQDVEKLEYQALMELAASTYQVLLEHELQPGDVDAKWVAASAHLLASSTISMTLDVALLEPPLERDLPRVLKVRVDLRGFTVFKEGVAVPPVPTCRQGPGEPTLCLVEPSHANALERYDWMGFYNLLLELKYSHPDWEKHETLEVGADREVDYSVLIQTMDMARSQRAAPGTSGAPRGQHFTDVDAFKAAVDLEVGGQSVHLFPNIVLTLVK